MRILFLASGPFAVPILEALHGAGHEIDLVTLPPSPRGRRGKAVEPPAIAWARARGVHFRQPTDLTSSSFLAAIREQRPEVGFAVDYGKRIPKALFSIPGAIWNLHPSILPRWRGAAPIPWAILEGDTETGVTLFRIVEKMDAGPVAAVRRAEIRPDEDAESLEKRLSHVAAALVLEMLPALASGQAPAAPQDETHATHARKLGKPDGLADWTERAERIERKCRALRPWPGLATTWQHPKRGRMRLTIEAARCGPLPAGLRHDLSAGEVQVMGERLFVGTGEGILEILRLKPEGKQPLSAAELLRGYPLKSEDRLGS